MMEALRQVRDHRAKLLLDRVRRDSDEIRARCATFAGFVKEAWPILEPATPLVWSWHMDALCEHLEALATGRMTPRLIINVPPGSSKSLLASVFLHAWIWGPRGQPGKRYVGTSFRAEIATRDSRKARDLMMSEWYQALWPIEFTRTGEGNFANTAMGSRLAVAFSSLMGERGDILGIDDPHSLDGAESETERNKNVRRFVEGGQSRINDRVNSIILIIMQRLHMEDLTGAVLARNLGYEHLMIPMRYEPERSVVTSIGWKDPRTFDGELMDPKRVPESEVRKEEESEYSFAGQYQQRPAPREGGRFKVDNIQKVQSVPLGAKRVRGWDIAGSTRKKSPYTAGARLAYVDGIIYIEDMRRARLEIDQAEALIVNTCHEDGLSVRQSLPQDPGQAGKAQKHHLSNRLLGLDFSFSPETGTKEDRAIPLASMVNSGQVRMVVGPWNAACEDEMRNFPNGTYKDQVDALSRAFSEMAKFMNPNKPSVGAPLYFALADD